MSRKVIYDPEALKKAIVNCEDNIERMREAIEKEQNTIAEYRVYIRQAEEE